MTMHMVVGPPASGKSTFVEQNAGAAPRFDFDAVAATVAGVTDLSHDIPQPVLDTVLALRRGLMGWCLDAETSTPELWVINANPSPSTIARWVAAGGVFYLLDPGVDECLARAARAGRPDWTESAIRAWYSSPPELPDNQTTKGGPPMKRTKNFDIRVKAAGPDSEAGGSEELDSGEIVAYASTFGTRDSYGDVIVKGAFAETLAEWKDSGNTLPLLYGHDFADPFSNIGGITEAVEDDHGLKITARLDLDNAKAAQVYHLLKERRLSQLSFAFDVIDGAESKSDDEWSFEIRKVKLYECSIVPVGANQETSVVSVKADGGDAGGAPPKDQTAKLRDLLEQALGLLEPPDDSDGDEDTAGGEKSAGEQPNSSYAAAVKSRLAILALKECQ